MIGSINSFRAVYCSGFVIPNQATVSAIALLFEKIYLPNNIEFIIDIAERFEISTPNNNYKGIQIQAEPSSAESPIEKLSIKQQENAYKYMNWCFDFAFMNSPLFGSVFESEAYDDSGPIRVELVKQGGPGELNTYEVSPAPMQLIGEEPDSVTKLIQSGYVPVVGSFHNERLMQGGHGASAKELAALLAIKSVEMFFPATKPVPADVILEARDKLQDQLPQFWSAMFKLSVDLRQAIEASNSPREISAYGADLVDTIVRPALTDLNHKIELERKQWFWKIFGGAFKALKIAATNPPLTQEQLIRTSLMIGSDAVVNLSETTFKVKEIKSQIGLTYLLDLDGLLNNN